MSKLFIVSTPIGNLEDITIRAIQILKKADIILAEDTRRVRKLLSRYNIPDKSLLSFFQGNEEQRILRVINLLKRGKDIALVSESGTPLISDPGYKLVKALLEKGVKIEAVPGPTALITALSVSGLPTNSFLFLGFLPKKKGKIRKILKELTVLPRITKTVIFYESPYRLISTLQLIKEAIGDKEIVIARELTKIHEEIRHETVASALTHFRETKPRGEFTLLLKL